MREQLAGDVAESRWSKLLDKLVQKLVDEGYITIEEPASSNRTGRARQAMRPQSSAKFEVTDKSLDFLGFKTLKDLLGSLGKSSFGAHDTRDLATGVETSGRGEAVRVRRHAESGHQRRRCSRRCGAKALKVPLNLEYSRSARASVRISELLRHGADARLQPQHDSLRRGSLHAGEEGGAGAGAPDSHAVSRRQPALRAVPRFGARSCASASWRACRWVRTTPTRATA